MSNLDDDDSPMERLEGIEEEKNEISDYIGDLDGSSSKIELLGPNDYSPRLNRLISIKSNSSRRKRSKVKPNKISRAVTERLFCW